MKHLTAIGAFFALCLPAAAQVALDLDADGAVSLEELQATFPEMGEDRFAEMDTDEDGTLSEEEVQAAIEAGLLPQ